MNSRIIIYIDICFNVDSWFSWKALQFRWFNFSGFDIILRPAMVGMYVVLEYVLMSWLIMIKSVLEFWRCYVVLFSFCFLSTSLFEGLLIKSSMLAWFREVTKILKLLTYNVNDVLKWFMNVLFFLVWYIGIYYLSLSTLRPLKGFFSHFVTHSSVLYIMVRCLVGA